MNFNSLINKTVEINNVVWTITAVSTKVGKMKNGSEAPYFTAVNEAGEEKEVHPRAVAQLIKAAQAEDNQPQQQQTEEVKMDQANALIATGSAQQVHTVVEGNVIDINAREVQDSGTAIDLENNVVNGADAKEPTDVTDVVAKPVDQAAPAPFVAVTKKSRAQAIFLADRAAGLARKETIAKFKSELGMSDQGASTYYQNFKSGNWQQPAAK